jgi:hypothetical protein
LFGFVAQRNVVDVDEDLVAALAVPYLAAGVPGVAQDGSHCGLGPRDAVAVAVTCRIVRGRAGDAVACECLGDGVQALASEVLAEDPLDDRCGGWVEFQAVAALAGGGLARVGMRTEIDEAVAVRRAASEEAALSRCLGCHGRPHADLYAIALPFRHAAVERHHQIVRIAAGIDSPADLGHPQADAVVHEHRERQAELVAVERPGRFADDNRVEPAVSIAQRFQQLGGLRATLPRQRSGFSDVEVLGDDLAAVRADQRPRTGQLPVS